MKDAVRSQATAPRNFRGAMTDVRCVALKRTLSGQIATLVDAGYTDFLSGMAEGSDTWAALAVFALKKENPALKLHCVLPCEGQADQWSVSAR